MEPIGPLHDPVTWYKITHAGEQVAQLDFQNRAGQGGLVRVALFWKSHSATCSPACVILHHVTGSYKGPVGSSLGRGVFDILTKKCRVGMCFQMNLITFLLFISSFLTLAVLQFHAETRMW